MYTSEIRVVLDELIRRILEIDPKVRCYLTEAGYWLGFQIGPRSPSRRGRPFVRLVTPRQSKYQNKTFRVFVTTPPRRSLYDDPEGLLRYQWSTPHIEQVGAKDIPAAMRLIEQAFRFKSEA
jgi:hypothetical protein